MAKQNRAAKVYDIGFAVGYQGDQIDLSPLVDGELTHYEAGYKAGGEHFDRVTEIMQVTGRSLREVHQFAIDSLYEITREKILE